MKRKIFYNSNSFVLTDRKNTKKSDSFFICENKSDIKAVISSVLDKQNMHVTLYNSNFLDLEAMFAAQFTYIEAAGGVVANEFGNILYMFRNNMWDLPKGKLDKGESTEDAALREVQEETGLQNVVCNSFVCSTWHIYPYKQAYALKQTYWYAMSALSSEELVPETQEGIQKLCWLNQAEITELQSQTYPAIVEVQKAYNSLL